MLCGRKEDPDPHQRSVQRGGGKGCRGRLQRINAVGHINGYKVDKRPMQQSCNPQGGRIGAVDAADGLVHHATPSLGTVFKRMAQRREARGSLKCSLRFMYAYTATYSTIPHYPPCAQPQAPFQPTHGRNTVYQPRCPSKHRYPPPDHDSYLMPTPFNNQKAKAKQSNDPTSPSSPTPRQATPPATQPAT